MRKFILGLFFLFLPALALAGVTIHYSGEVADASKAKAVISEAEKYAAEHKWRVEKLIGGVVLYPAEWCEPLNIKFVKETALESNFVKTQFAGPEIHRDVIGLFRQLKPLTIKLEIEDEGEYWEASDFSKLELNIESVNVMMKQIKAQKPNVKGPAKIGEGRIVDLHE